MISKVMYTVKQGNKTVGLSQNNKYYIIGFENPVLARKVQYNLQPNPEITLLRGKNINLASTLNDFGLKNTDLFLDIEATLFIPKFKGSVQDPMNDGGYHLGADNYNEFIVYPFTKSIGLVLPFKLDDEDEDEFMFRAHVIEPTFNSFLFG